MIVLTQTAETRSVAFLSQSSNEGKDKAKELKFTYGIWRSGDQNVILSGQNITMMGILAKKVTY